jgi:hypothetical protein
VVQLGAAQLSGHSGQHYQGGFGRGVVHWLPFA